MRAAWAKQLHTLSTLDGTLTAGPCIHRRFPEGRATILMKGTRKDIIVLPKHSGVITPGELRLFLNH